MGFFNLSGPTDWWKVDFGPALDPKNSYEHDGWVNLGEINSASGTRVVQLNARLSREIRRMWK